MPEAMKVLETVFALSLPLVIAGLGWLAYNKPDQYLFALRRLSLMLFFALFAVAVHFFMSSWLDLNNLSEIAPADLKAALHQFKANTENKIMWLCLIASAPFIGIQVGSFFSELKEHDSE
ncbi:MAG: succinate dehydrogenase/fumarate reductase cytochrome b subunit [Arenicella sp.]|jgi:succinate dehydrogenase/fumarate reductase cytochrome b subunit